MHLRLLAFLTCFVAVYSQHLGHFYSDHGGHDYLDSSDATHKHGHHGALDEYGNSGYAKHGHHELDTHKARGEEESHHDLHKARHDKGYYERKKGHGFVKAYAYDHIKSHHDKGSSLNEHKSHHAHHASEGLRQLEDDGAHGYAKHAKKIHHGGYGYSDAGKTLKKHGHHGYDSRAHHAPIPILLHPAYSAPVYAGPAHHTYLH
ncbi:histidine-rich protein PFHRP-II-like [Argiope bruennichi]|uniref:histidine-rich protein PFHRP-II-like n=1 Tax=Argiope bruennichi TaxID=94029 RepID=UPI0024949EEE|nr:histidine-rich protein PFHRP-II-like [Argiope bruennichi]